MDHVRPLRRFGLEHVAELFAEQSAGVGAEFVEARCELRAFERFLDRRGPKCSNCRFEAYVMY